MKKIFILITAFLCSYNIFPQTIPPFQVILGDTLQTSGYYFFHAFKQSGTVPSGFHSMILDKYGRVVYYKKFSFTQSDFKLLPNGKMSYAYTPGNPNIAKFHIMDSTFTVVDSVQCAGGVLTDTHDMQLLSNGHYLVMGYEFRTMDLSSYHWFNGNGTPGSTTASVKCGIIQELDQNKNLIFSWNAGDHYQFGDVQEKWLSGPVNVDWTHFNSVEMDSDGNLLVSLRHFSEVTKINRQNGNIIWRLGGKQNQFTFLNDPFNGFDGQHDARRITNGNITLYDDGFLIPSSHPARGTEYNINETAHTAQLVWSHSYSSNSFASALGNVQRLGNGNTVSGWGNLKNANVTFNCVKPDGSLVLEIRFPDTLFTYRAFNYPSLPWTLKRPQISCGIIGANFYLSAPSGFASYKWSTGDTTRSIQVTTPGTFNVFVPYGTGGYISSERVIITSMINVCSQVTGIQTAVNNIPEQYELFQNYPNPFNPTTKIRYEIPSGLSSPNASIRDLAVTLKVFDALGREVETLVDSRLSPGIYEITFNAASYPSGVYFYKLSTENFSDTKRMILLK